MIDAKDLRIGNKVIANGLHEGREMTVEQIGSAGTLREENRVIKFKEHEVGEFAKDLEPIPLSPEVLEKAGYTTKTNKSVAEFYWNYWLPNKFGIAYCVKSIEGYAEKGKFYWGESLKPIIYLHKLQNLYYELTGQEIQFNNL